MSGILVTGASRGIGRGIAVELSGAGHRVAVHYNSNRDAALETARRCAELNGSSTPENDLFQADLSIPEDRKRLVTEVIDRHGSPDGVVNNAGIAPRKREDIVVGSEESFNEVLRTNLTGPYFLTQAFAQHWLENSPGRTRRVVFVTSVSAEMASTERGEYCISKAALSMARQLYAARLSRENILVFEIRPGIIATDMTAAVKAKYDPLIADGLVPQRRWGEPVDIGKAVRALFDGLLDFCTGSVINADGGLSLHRL